MYSATQPINQPAVHPSVTLRDVARKRKAQALSARKLLAPGGTKQRVPEGLTRVRVGKRLSVRSHAIAPKCITQFHSHL